MNIMKENNLLFGVSENYAIFRGDNVSIMMILAML